MRGLNLSKVDGDSQVPRYVQAKTILAEAIRSGTFPPGSQLPSTSEIGTRVNVSLITAHKAIQCLVQEGWLRRERGRGTFVRPDFEASVAAKPQFRVALVLHPVSPLDDFYHGALMSGIHLAGEETEVAGEQVIQRFRQPGDLDAVDADGLICFHPYGEDIDRLLEIAQRKRLVVLGASVNGKAVHCVDSQNFNGARTAVRHLIELGHERIAIINGPVLSTNCQHRWEGYLAELNDHRMPIRDEYIFNAELAKSAEAVLHRLAGAMRGKRRPTAIFACGYYLALDVMTLLQDMGLKIPKDVSLIAFDDPKSASLLNPPLTTVRQPLTEMGMRAYERVVQLIQGEEPSSKLQMLPTSFILRESTGPVG